MKIAWVELLRYTLPLVRAVPVRGAELTTRAGYLLKLANGHGHFGLGEIAPLPGFSRETLRTADEQARNFAELLKGQTLPLDVVWLLGGLRAWHGVPASVRTGVSMAIESLHAAVAGETLAAHLNPRHRAETPINALLSGDSASVVAQAARARSDGYRAAKLKVGRGNPEAEAELVRQVAEALGPGVALRLDANRAWDLDTAIRFAREIGNVPVAYVEEPLRAPAQLSEFASATGMPYALDETLGPALATFVDVAAGRVAGRDLALESAWPLRPGEETLRALVAGAAAVVIKPSIAGEFARLPLLLAELPGFKGKVVISSAFESSVGIAAFAQLAAALPAAAPAGLDTGAWLRLDVTAQPLRPAHGAFAVDDLDPLFRGAALENVQGVFRV